MKLRSFTKGRRQDYLRPFVFIILLLLANCSAGSYGRLQWSDEALDIFESANILENHTYYFFGPEAEPEAIIALDNQYVLAPSLWKKIAITPLTLSRWMERIDNRHRYVKEKYQGALIVDQQGNRLGIWYSYVDWTVIKRGEENEVVIYTPDTSRLHRDIRDRDHSPGTK
ncbi:MAG: hypothetical protein KAQ71_01705 [Desulfobulbaceae bacterium]|nr:hypothetical protein [Desulfobulbaceae bacterium]